MRTMTRLCFVVSLSVAGSMTGAQEDEAAAEKAEAARVAKIEASLKYLTGKVTVGKDLAAFDLPEGFRFLGPSDARKVLEDIWGNPKDLSVLGLLVTSDFQPSGEGQWAIEINYEEDGYIKDDDAASLDFDDILADMQEDARDSNEARVKQGYPPVDVVGWATKPRYDAKEKKLYWAKELKFGDSKDHTLNYNIRILGRRGVLILNAIADMEDLQAVEAVTPKVLSFVDFKAGNRYEDFDPELDKVAAYGIGGLIAGKLALKVGLLKGLWLAILAGKKFVILGLVAAGAVMAKLLTRKKQAPAG